ITGSMAVGKWLSLSGMLLLLLWETVATTLPRDKGPTSQDDMQATAEVKRESLLAWWHEWTSQTSAGALIGGDARGMSKRQEGPALQPCRDETPCQSFFWKTFSCKY
uniref:Cortistatin n=1 Tax=Jaculus jaculus TaxID=51337 RepID=A0A8C5NZ85_JACJA